MHDETIAAILKRLDEIEREYVRLRKGSVADLGPLDVRLGAASTAYNAVPQLTSGLSVPRSGNVAALVRGNDILVLGELGTIRLGPHVTFYTGILGGGATGNFGPFNHGLSVRPDFILGSTIGAANSEVNMPGAAQWGTYRISETQFYVQVVADPVATAVDWHGFAVNLPI